MNSKKYLVALHMLWFQQKKLKEVFTTKENYKEIYTNLSFSFLKQHWFSNHKIDEILEQKNKINFKEIENTIKNLNIKIITIKDKQYPKSLKYIFNAPYLIYLRWNLPDTSLAFVGSRQMTSYWKKAIEKLVPEVWKYFNIISWWALWCDSESHRVALANNIKTFAITWTWIDKTYPAENKQLYEEIIQKWWWIISIFPLNTVWHPSNFPIRNEIVAWLAEWIIVIEAKEKSGSLITARLGLDLWKDVFALPWEIFKLNSLWTNKLIASSEAKMIISSEDILNEYDIIWDNQYDFNSMFLKDEEEKRIYNLLLLEPHNTDELAKKLSIWMSELILKISILELSMLIKKWDNWKYEII